MQRFAQGSWVGVALSVVFLGVLPAQAQTITQWNFNASNLTPSTGAGTFTNVATLAFTFPVGTNSTDPGSPNQSASVAGFPLQGAGSDTAGVAAAVSTAGASNIVVRFDSQLSATCSRYFQFAYTTDGTNFTNLGSPIDFAVFPATFFGNNRTFDLSGIAGVANNPNFGFRIFSVFDPANGTQYTAVGGIPYTVNGTFRNDMVTVSQGFSWIGGSGNDIATGANFSGGTSPSGTTSTLLFGSAGGANLSPTVVAATTVDQVIFQAGAGTYNLSGSAALTIGAGIVNNSTVAQTISAPVVFNAQQSIFVPNASASLTFTNTVQLFTSGAAGALSVQGAGNVTFSNTISGGPASGNGLRIGSGTGTVTLAADNTYSGNTLVLGNLLANNPNAGGTGSATGAGTVTVNPGGRLGGTGRIAGPINVGSATLAGGTIRPGPGNAVGNLQAGSTVTFFPGNILDVYAGSSSASQLNVTGALTTPTGAMTINVFNNGTLDLTGATSYSYTIATSASTTGFANTVFTVNPANFFFTALPTITNPGGTSIVLGFTPVPEPTSLLAVGAGTLLFGRLIRRRKAK
jgi:autotransporter-associated beta strand protein